MQYSVTQLDDDGINNSYGSGSGGRGRGCFYGGGPEVGVVGGVVMVVVVVVVAMTKEYDS